MMTYSEAKYYMENKGIKTRNKYANWWIARNEENIRIGIPQHPEEYFKHINDKKEQLLKQI